MRDLPLQEQLCNFLRSKSRGSRPTVRLPQTSVGEIRRTLEGNKPVDDKQLLIRRGALIQPGVILVGLAADEAVEIP